MVTQSSHKRRKKNKIVPGSGSEKGSQDCLGNCDGTQEVVGTTKAEERSIEKKTSVTAVELNFRKRKWRVGEGNSVAFPPTGEGCRGFQEQGGGDRLIPAKKKKGVHPQRAHSSNRTQLKAGKFGKTKFGRKKKEAFLKQGGRRSRRKGSPFEPKGVCGGSAPNETAVNEWSIVPSLKKNQTANLKLSGEILNNA